MHDCYKFKDPVVFRECDGKSAKWIQVIHFLCTQFLKRKDLNNQRLELFFACTNEVSREILRKCYSSFIAISSHI